jgi:glycosyltransferase involved in cell wall biosynthesis
MPEPSLSILIPTRFPDKPLNRLLSSIQKQIGPDDEILVAIDIHTEKSLPTIKEVVESFGNQYKWFEFDAGHHCWGHCQLNFLLNKASKDYILYNDDDDIFTDNAFDSIRGVIKSLSEPMAVMFKFITHFDRTPLWKEKKVVYAGVGGHNLVLPNVKEKLGRFTCRYGGDFDWVLSACHNWNYKIYWAEQIIVVQKPEESWQKSLIDTKGKWWEKE